VVRGEAAEEAPQVGLRGQCRATQDAEEVLQEVQVDRERMSARMHARSTTLVEEDRLHTPQDNNNIPSSSPHTPAPAEPPNKATNRQNNPLSIELEGERSYPSCDVGPTSDDADASTASK
jgi:hypothetical protein